jgi:hypothetical protein
MGRRADGCPEKAVYNKPERQIGKYDHRKSYNGGFLHSVREWMRGSHYLLW